MRDKHDNNNKHNNFNNQKQAKLTESEVKFVTNNEACRIATTYNNVPHLVPISYIYENGFFYFASDYDTKKYRNLEKNNKAALVIDVYNSSVNNNRAVIVQGITELIKSGNEFKRLYKIFEKEIRMGKKRSMERRRSSICKIKTK